MNSDQMQKFLDDISRVADVNSDAVSLLKESLACYLDVFARSVDATSVPPSDLMSTSASLLLLSNAANTLDSNDGRNIVDYLIGMGFEQTGELLSRVYIGSEKLNVAPIESDDWYRLSLSLLHYLAGGFRVQAYGALQNLRRLSAKASEQFRSEYSNAFSVLQSLYYGRPIRTPITEWERLIFSNENPVNIQGKRIRSITRRIQELRQIFLSELGEGNEGAWLNSRGIYGQDAIAFWTGYLAALNRRGIASFTDEQRGPNRGFDDWLRTDNNILVILPTGAGKTIIGELKTALMLSINKQVVWILPTRSLVRQAKRQIENSFRNLGVVVEELPTTEDFQPLFADEFPNLRYVAVTTPEKLSALMRTRPNAVANVGLVVFDEAQNLFNEGRGATFEFVLETLGSYLPNCRFIFMSAISDSTSRLRLFANRLKPDIRLDELISENRPTRRINGVLTTSEDNHALALFYPPGHQDEDGHTVFPHQVTFSKIKIPRQGNSLKISLKTLKMLTKSKLRTVLFVGRRDSTITQAREIAKSIKRNVVSLPAEDLDRLQVELGRDSLVAQYGLKGVAPHHAGLSPVEQHLIEKWIRNDLIRTVVATPTLAQGINLPFDLSIVCSLQRFNPQTEAWEDIPYSEILNMLGRAGRAGYVADGISLIAAAREGRSPVEVLDRHRRYYFHPREDTSQFLGLSRLLIKANRSNIENPDWLYNLGSMTFHEAQALVSFSLRTVLFEADITNMLSNRLRLFPSVRDLTEYFGQDVNVMEILTSPLSALVANLRTEFGNDTELQEATMRTGMPIEVLRRYLVALHENYDLQGKSLPEIFAWADAIVSEAILGSRNREWFSLLFKGLEFNETLESIRQWRSGARIVEIENRWKLAKNKNQNQIAIGVFFNHTISLLAQFWGALAICEEIVYPEVQTRYLENIQSYTRMGISSLEALEWLSKIGDIDRVMAHKLVEITPNDLDRQTLRNFIVTRLNEWRANRGSIPLEINQEYLGALTSILNS